MKNKILKICLLISTLLIISGAIITGVAYNQGGRVAFKNANYGIFSTIAWDHDNSNETNHFTSEQNIKQLELNIECSNVEIKSGNTFSITTKGIKKNKISFNDDNGIAKLEIKNNSNVLHTNDLEIETVIVIPTSCTNITTTLNVGDFDIENIKLDTLSLNMDLGEASLENMNINEGDIQLSVGDFDFSGSFNKQLSIICNTGDVDIELNDSIESYNYELRTDLGELKVSNFYNNDGISGDYSKNNNSNKLLKAKVDLGNLEIEQND